MNINTLVPIAVVLVVAFFTISIGSVILEDASETFCDGTWITNTTTPYGGVVNPIYDSNFGCCTTLASGNCTTWNTDVSLKTSGEGLLALDELAGWGPTLALVIVAAIIIGVLVTYLARGAGGSV